VAARCGGSRLQNGSGGGEDAGRALVGDFLFGPEPVLNITTAKVRALEAKRFAANWRHGLRLNLADVPCGLFAIHKLFRYGVPENNVGDLAPSISPASLVTQKRISITSVLDISILRWLDSQFPIGPPSLRSPHMPSSTIRKASTCMPTSEIIP